MALNLLSNPKLAAPSSSSAARWYPFYAMFSEAFAAEAIRRSCLPKGSTICDMWAGAGTTTYMAAAADMRSIGIDINPVMLTIARGRTVHCVRAISALEKLKPIYRRIPSITLGADALNAWFGSQTAAAIRHLQHEINRHDALDSREKSVLTTALFDVARKLGKPYQSKNPTWLKKPSVDARVNVSPKIVAALFEDAAKARAQLCPKTVMKYLPSLQLGTSTGIKLLDESVDLVLTSPPYCTRIDYAVSTRLELAVLGHSDQGVDALREFTMGTTSIREHSIFASKKWGRSCANFLTEVENHPSRSSRSYYYKTYLQYFEDLYRSVAEISRVLRNKAQCVIVVQDSYYKGIHTDLPKIVTQMAATLGLTIVNRQDYRILRSMRNINTRSRKYRSSVDGVESSIWFTK